MEQHSSNSIRPNTRQVVDRWKSNIREPLMLSAFYPTVSFHIYSPPLSTPLCVVKQAPQTPLSSSFQLNLAKGKYWQKSGEQGRG